MLHTQTYRYEIFRVVVDQKFQRFRKRRTEKKNKSSAQPFLIKHFKFSIVIGTKQKQRSRKKNERTNIHRIWILIAESEEIITVIGH